MATTFKTCSVDGCNSDASTEAQGARGFCRAHYSRWRRYGDPLAGRASPGSPPRPCAVEDCGDDASASGGYCNRHYLRFRKYGDPLGGVHDVHGMARTRLYNIWKGMRGRCGHKRGTKPIDAKNYRDKGIRVCDAWQRFPPFSEWAMANGYADDLSIDRVDSNGNYEPGNCRWVTMLENARAASRKLTMDDAREIRRLRNDGMAATTLANRYGVSRRLVRLVVAGERWADQDLKPS